MVKYALIALIALVVAAGAYFLFFKKDELSLVKAQIGSLAAEASKQSQQEAPLTSAAKAQALAGLFAETCEVKIDGVPISGVFRRDEIPGHAMLVRGHFQKALFTIHDLDAELATELTAKASFTIMLVGTLGNGESVREVRDINAQLVKADGKWRISSLLVASPVKK